MKSSTLLLGATSLTFALALPAQTSTDPSSSTSSAPRLVDSDTPDGLCTTLKFIAPSFTFGPTRTVFTTTATTTSTLDCGDCDAGVRTTFVPLGVPPVAFFTTTVTADGPASTTEYVCGKPTDSSGEYYAEGKNDGKRDGEEGEGEKRGEEKRHVVKNALEKRMRVEHALGEKTITPPDVPAPTCTSATQLEPVIPNSTKTVYAGTTTTTSEIDCGDCAVKWSSGTVYFFAPVIPTTTTTVQTPSMKVELACKTG